jgi:hypothetical protein
VPFTIGIQSHSSPDKTAPPLLGTVRDLSSGKRVEIGGTSVRLLGDKFRDYRQQLIPWDQFKREVSAYGEQTGIPTEAKQFVQSLQEKLISTSRNTDERFPQNESVRIENGEPILSPLCAKHEPEDLKVVETWIKERMGQVDIVDALVDTEHWLYWTRHFGPLSGHDAKVDQPRERYVLTVFCYGCNLGPTQTARSIKTA